MAKYVIVIKTDNAAFNESPSYEVARILRGLAEQLEEDGLGGSIRLLRDSNGNRVGEAKLTED